MDLSNLTAKELSQVETLSKTSIMAMEDPKTPKMPLLIAMAYVITKKDNPKIKFSEVENYTLDQIMEIVSPPEDDEASKLKS